MNNPIEDILETSCSNVEIDNFIKEHPEIKIHDLIVYMKNKRTYIDHEDVISLLTSVKEEVEDIVSDATAADFEYEVNEGVSDLIRKCISKIRKGEYNAK